MNPWLWLVLPILIFNVLIRFIHYIFNKGTSIDKNIIVIFIGIAEMIGFIIITMLVNGMDFTNLVFWLLLLSVPLNYLQTAFDTKVFEKQISKFNSFLATTIISSIVFFGLLVVNIIEVV